MPHLIIEYSANLEDRVDITDLMETLHETAIATGVFPRKGVRTRASRRDQYLIADHHPDNAFVHLIARIGHGRSLELRQKTGETLFHALCDALQAVMASSPLAISFEIQEIDPNLNFKKNNLPVWLERREEKSGNPNEH